MAISDIDPSRHLTTDVKRHWRQPGSDLTCGYTDRPERLSCSTLLTDHSTPCRHPWEVIRPVVSGGTEDAKARNKGDHDCRLIRLPSRAKPDGSSATYPSGLALEGSRESVQRRSALFVFLHRVSKPEKDCLYIQYIRVTFGERARKPLAPSPTAITPATPDNLERSGKLFRVLALVRTPPQVPRRKATRAPYSKSLPHLCY